MAHYSRDAAVAAVRKYYTFLATELGAIPIDSIIEPPPEGWPQLTADALAPLGKNAAVVDLLRHLPYLQMPPRYEMCEHIAFETRGIQYPATNTLDKIAKGRIEGTLSPAGAGEIPPHVAVLTKGARYGSWLLLDTQEGTMTDYIQQERPKRDTPDMDSPDFWRAYETLPVEHFFAQWRENFRSLEWVVNPYEGDDGMMLRRDQATDENRQIYREHGWPDEFRREDCHAALLEWHTVRRGLAKKPLS